MPAHPRKRLSKRQASGIPIVQSVSGFNNVASTAALTATNTDSLALNTATDIGTAPSPVSAPDIAPSYTPTITVPTTIAPSSTPVASTASSNANSTSSSSLSTSTVVLVCLGSVVGLVAFLMCLFWWNKRGAGQRRPTDVAKGDVKNAAADQERRRSRLEPWTKLAEGDDTWENMHRGHQQAGESLENEKLSDSGFKESLNEKGVDKLSGGDMPMSPPFLRYHPKLSEDPVKGAQAPQARFVGPAGAHANIDSWGGSTIGEPTESFLSLRDSHALHMSFLQDSGAMSPNVAVKNTPPAVEQSHKWETAEVEHVDEEKDRKDKNPFVDEPVAHSRRPSGANPFFNAKGSQDTKRTRNPDPFSDSNTSANVIQLESTTTANHQATQSNDSTTSSNERAIQSLIAALEVPPNPIQGKLSADSGRLSAQPSMVSERFEEGDASRRF